MCNVLRYYGVIRPDIIKNNRETKSFFPSVAFIAAASYSADFSLKSFHGVTKILLVVCFTVDWLLFCF